MPTSQPDSSAISTSSSPPAEDDIVDALDLKRQELDKEISAFQAEKEEEYNRFKTEIKERRASILWNEDDGSTAITCNGSSAAETAIPPPVESNPPPLRDSPTHSPSHDKSSSPATSTEERELELRSLFTPSYLPLLEDPPQRRRKNNALPSRPSQNKRQSAPSPLSSSLTLSSAVYSPPRSLLETRKLSSSQPRPALLDHRRSSSRSDTSMSGFNLRSSLRQPKTPEQEEQKGRKHVLFSINDVVMSPSSSPVVQRAAPKKPPILLPGLQVLPESDMMRSSALSHSSPISPRAVQPPNFLPPQPTSPGIARSYRELVEPTDSPLQLMAKDEPDFAMNAGEDPLFDFDEDATVHDMSEEDEKIRSHDSDDELPTGSQSPHVGSLPIEIKWPVRKGV